MGWLFLYGASRKDVIAECIADNEHSRTLRHCARGNVLWVLRESGPKGESKRYIMCFLLQRDNSTGDWGYKDMDESMHPCYYTCPVSYLDAASEPVNKYAAEWRQAVREVTRFSKGVWSSRLRLYPEGFFEVYLPVPPLEEQDQIIAFIGDEQQRVDVLSSAVERSLKLAGERREAIIAAAVTGQLDLINLQ